MSKVDTFVFYYLIVRMFVKYFHIAKGVVNIRGVDSFYNTFTDCIRAETIHYVHIRDVLIRDCTGFTGRHIWLCEKPVFQSNKDGVIGWMDGKVWKYEVVDLDCDVEAISNAILSTSVDKTFTWPLEVAPP